MAECKRKTKSLKVKDIYANIGKKFIYDLTIIGLINERTLRDLTVREEYEFLLDKGIRSKDARKILSEKVFTSSNGESFCLGEKNIEKIIYLTQLNFMEK